MLLESKSFNTSDLVFGKISIETHNEHIKLYEGYVKNANTILAKINEYKHSPDLILELGELFRRFSFEYNGVKNHELYFEQISHVASELASDSSLYQAITEQWGSFEDWKLEFIQLAKTRGIGWAILYHDPERNILLNTWVDEQHLGHLNSCRFIFGIDMWEHSFVHDYLPSGKAQYILDYIDRTNWNIVADRYHS